MSIQRIVRRLPARRQQRMLALDTPRFVALTLGAGDSGATFGVLATLALLVTLANHGLGRWFDGPAPLGPFGVVVTAGLGTGAWLVLRAAFAPSRRFPVIERRALAAALTRELEVAGQDRAEIETVACTATHAWVRVVDGAVRLLVLECDASTWIALRGPLVAARFEGTDTFAIGQRVAIERLRWTGAMISLTVGGATVVATPIAIGELEGTAECEVWREHELPASIAAAIDRAGAVYR